jgi:4-amino-4-deoxy-L-arabinose transferase-like glycosyltransferase
MPGDNAILSVTTVQEKPRSQKITITVLLVVIILLGAFLRFYHLGAAGWGNQYYAAGVQSMLTSWNNFFFVSAEPGGSVSIDKPPLGFWMQALSASIFGLSGFSLALPQAICGVLSIPLLFWLVKRAFGEWPGLAAAAVLAVMPVAISAERNNTIDGQLVFVLLLAIWALWRSIENGKLRYLLLGAVFIGLGFNIKMLQAYMILPAFYLGYFLTAPHKWGKRIWHLIVSTIVMVVISFSWAVAVDLTPAEDRPYVGSSTDNSVMELIIGHNGIERILGGMERLRTLDNFSGTDAPEGANFSPNLPAEGNLSANQGNLPAGQANLPPRQNPYGPQQGQRPPDAAGNYLPVYPGMDGQYDRPYGDASGGRMISSQPGIFRLFDPSLSGEASWLLPLALAGLLIGACAAGWKKPLGPAQTGLIVWGGWLLPMAAYFSLTSGLFHEYYLIMLGPGIAGLVAAFIWATGRIAQTRPWFNWVLSMTIIGACLAVEFYILTQAPIYLPWMVIAALLFVIGAILHLPIWSGKKIIFTNLGMGSLIGSVLIAPLVWSFLTTFNTNPIGGLPLAGPGEPVNGYSRNYADINENLIAFLEANTSEDQYLVAVPNANTSAPLILATGRNVLPMGGFTGGDPVVTVDSLQSMVESGEIRYILGVSSYQNQSIKIWVTQNCTPVSPSVWNGGTMQNLPIQNQGINSGSDLYDCAD